MTMKLYLDPITVNCRKVLAGFKLMGTNFEQEKVDYFTGQFKSPEFTAINPTSRCRHWSMTVSSSGSPTPF